MAAIHTHDDLDTARAITISIFGKNWEPHIFAVLDRLQARARELARDDDGV